MQTDTKNVDTILSALGISLPLDLLAQLDIVEYLDQLDHVLALAAGERQRLGDLLRAAERITSAQLADALAEQQQGRCKLGEILIKKGLLTQKERDAVLEFQRRQKSLEPASGKFALGNVLVANGQISRSQLEDALLRQVSSGRRLGEELITAGHASQEQVDDGLFLQRKLITYALAVTMGLVPLVTLVPSAEAAQKSAALAVSVTVIANAKLNTAFQAAQLNISAADVARGYVDVPAASRFSVATNSRSGYLLHFHPLSELFESARVDGLTQAGHIGAEGGTIVQRSPHPLNGAHELNYRFMLRPDVAPGNYPWPLQLSVRALS